MTGRVIVITSGKGGVGKTTTSANIGTALAKGEIIDCIQQVGLTYTVVSDEAVQLGRECQLGLSDVFVVQYGNLLQYHA